MAKSKPNLDGSDLLVEPRRRYTDEEALAVMNHRGSAETRGRNTVHMRLERLWFEAVATFVGNDGDAISSVFASLDQDLAADDGASEFRANHIQGFVMRQVARLCASKGRFETMPTSSDWRDQRASKVGDHMLDYWYNHLNTRAVRRRLAFWQVICGTGFVYQVWDPKEGDQQRIYINPIDEEPKTADQLDPKTRALYEVLGAYTDEPGGDMEQEALSPFQVLVPASTQLLEKAPWMMIERVRSMEWLWLHYPKKAKEVRPDDFLETKVSLWWRRLAGLVLDRGAILPGTTSGAEESVVVREFWRPPSPLVKEGCRVVATNSMILENSPHPNFTDELGIRYPVRMARFQEVPGRLHGMGMVEHLVGVQREYNRSRNQIIMHRDILAHPQWLVPRGAQLTSSRVNIGDLWEHNPGFRPELQSPPAMSQTHIVTKDDAMNDMRLLASQSEVSQGQTIPGVRAGVAIRALQERDMETVSLAYEEHEECMQHVASDLLKWTHKYMKRTRAVSIYGSDMAVDIQYFTGSDLRGNTTVRVQQGSMAPKSKALAQSNMLDLLQMGALNPVDPQEKRLILHTLEIGDLDESFTLVDRNKRRAEVENDLFVNPKFDPVTGAMQPPPDVMDFDDHIVHHERHVAFMLTDTFENLDPAQKQVVMAHDLKHMKALAAVQQMLQQQAMMAKPQGSEPKETGTPSAPKRDASPAAA